MPQVLQVENVSYDVREMLSEDEAQLSAAMAILRQTHQNSQLQKSDYVPTQQDRSQEDNDASRKSASQINFTPTQQVQYTSNH